MLEHTKKMIAELTEQDIQVADRILSLLEGITYEKMDFERGERYRAKIQTIACDIRHIKELI